ncbi:MAG TPA: pseudouridine synthase [Candidatus Paceibacterota bacterium]|nr:pseudouridine synthase [Candidatus Paceibacterota bacterium]
MKGRTPRFPRKEAPKAAEKPLFPMRINKYLAHKGYATRTGADALIEAGKVFINGVPAVLGAKVEESDMVEVRDSRKPASYLYYAYHKPVGVITHSPQRGEKEAKEDIPVKGVFPVGRLDKDSYGLLILTNDGRITDRLLNPDYAHDKEYVVTVRKPLANNWKTRMERGVDIEGYLTKESKVEILDERTFAITLTEGKKHQIRRMCAALGNDVEDLKRVRVMNIRLGDLKPGSYRKIEGAELTEFLRSLGL